MRTLYPFRGGRQVFGKADGLTTVEQEWCCIADLLGPQHSPDHDVVVPTVVNHVHVAHEPGHGPRQMWQTVVRLLQADVEELVAP